jgi:hypothetical protein
MTCFESNHIPKKQEVSAINDRCELHVFHRFPLSAKSLLAATTHTINRQVVFPRYQIIIQAQWKFAVEAPQKVVAAVLIVW